MKKLYIILKLALFAGILFTTASCKKNDSEDQMIIKRTGNLAVKILNGEHPFANKKVDLLAASNGKLLDVLTTDATGSVSLSNFLEGTYTFSIEVTEPAYTKVSRQFQVISGETRNVTFQVTEQNGSLTVYLVDENDKKIVDENVNVGIALIPHSIHYEQAFKNSEKIALASAVKYFGTSGILEFPDMPSGNYDIFRVKADTIEKRVTTFFSIKQQAESVLQVKVKLEKEKIFKKIWELEGANNYNNGEAIEGFSIKSYKFYTTDSGDKIEFKMENGVSFSGNFFLYDEGEFDILDIKSSNPDYALNIGASELFFDGAQLVLKMSSIDIDTPDEAATHYNTRLTLK